MILMKQMPMNSVTNLPTGGRTLPTQKKMGMNTFVRKRRDQSFQSAVPSVVRREIDIVGVRD